MKTIQDRSYKFNSILIAAVILITAGVTLAGTGLTENSKTAYYEIVDQGAKLKDSNEALSRSIHYPRAAQLAGFEGRVIAKVYVNESGTVDDIEFVKKMGGGFETAIKSAIMDAKFTPAIYNKKSVKSVAVLSFKFELD